MNENNEKIIKECIKAKNIMHIERENIDYHVLEAIPVDMNNKFLLIQYIYDFYYDGFKLICLDDITSIKRGEIEKFHDKIVEEEEKTINIKDLVNVDIKEWKPFFQSIFETGKMIDIYLERKEEGRTFFVGKVVSVSESHLELLEIYPAGDWYKDTTSISYKDITMVSFNNNFCNMLEKYC